MYVWCIYMFLCVLVCACAHMCTSMLKPEDNVLVSLGHAAPYFFEERFLTEPRAHQWPGNGPVRVCHLDRPEPGITVVGYHAQLFARVLGVGLGSSCFYGKRLADSDLPSPWIIILHIYISTCVSFVEGVKPFPHLKFPHLMTCTPF